MMMTTIGISNMKILFPIVGFFFLSIMILLIASMPHDYDGR